MQYVKNPVLKGCWVKLPTDARLSPLNYDPPANRNAEADGEDRRNARSAEISLGVNLALQIASELGVASSDHARRDAIIRTILAARANGCLVRSDLLELARLALQSIGGDEAT